MARVSKEYYQIKKNSIIDAALEVCKRKTVSSVMMQDIIDEAGISQGGIYRYYNNIDEVLTDLLSRIRTEQYDSIDRLNEVIDRRKEEIIALRELPPNEESINKRRKVIVETIIEIHKVWGEEIQRFLYPHKKLGLEYTLLADNFPDRASRIFPNAKEERYFDGRIVAELGKEIEDGVIRPIISLEEFMEYNAAVYAGIIYRAIIVNCYSKNTNPDKQGVYDIEKRYETFAQSSCFFLGIEKQFEQYMKEKNTKEKKNDNH